MKTFIVEAPKPDSAARCNHLPFTVAWLTALRSSTVFWWTLEFLAASMFCRDTLQSVVHLHVEMRVFHHIAQ